jgi:hypothetical protein
LNLGRYEAGFWLNPERSALLIRLVNDYKNAWDRFGPLHIVDEVQASEMDPHLVWTQVEGCNWLGTYWARNQKQNPDSLRLLGKRGID